MELYFSDGLVGSYLGDGREVLQVLPKESIDMVCTSPPYWRQRKYPPQADISWKDGNYQFGREKDSGLYIEHTLEFFDLLHLCLKKTGNIFWNIGDSRDKKGQLLLIPQRLVTALQSKGWLLVNYIHWVKENPLPESITRRFTDSYEVILFLAKTKEHFFDQEAVRQPFAPATYERLRYPVSVTPGSKVYEQIKSGQGHPPQGKNLRHILEQAGVNCWDTWLFPTAGSESRSKYGRDNYACVDEETECLTAQGWKSYDKLQKGEIVAGYDLVEKVLKWQTLLDLYCYDVQDLEMVKVLGRSLDILVTPNHRCVIKTYHGFEKVKLASELVGRNYIRVAGQWSGDGLNPVSREMAELIGWYLTEGYENKMSSSVEIYQSVDVNLEKIERIRGLLKAVEAEWSEATYEKQYRDRKVHNVSFRIKGFIAYKLRELCPTKSVPTDVLLWKTSLLEALFKGLIGGDGYIRGSRRFLTQKDTDRVRMFQAIAFRLGYSVNVQPRAGGCSCIAVNPLQFRCLRSASKAIISKTRYTGRIWCPLTPTTTFVARRNGKVFITGNTFPIELPRRAILAGCPPYVCSNCGALYKRIIEKSRVNIWDKESDRLVKAVEPMAPLGETSMFRTGKQLVTVTIGWEPTCSCGKESQTGVVLDPFVGTGSTLVAAKSLGRRSIGIDVVPDFLKAARSRVEGTKSPFEPVTREWEPGPEREAEGTQLTLLEDDDGN